MTEFVCAMVGLLLGAALFALGFAARGGEKRAAAPAKCAEGEDERLRQIEADQRAFRALMGYNADVAYGTERMAREDGA